MNRKKEVYYIFILAVLVLFLKFQYEELMNDGKNNIVEQIRKSRHKSWSSNFNLVLKNKEYTYCGHDLFYVFGYGKLFFICGSFSGTVLIIRSLICLITKSKTENKKEKPKEIKFSVTISQNE